jgi:cytochrome c556
MNARTILSLLVAIGVSAAVVPAANPQVKPEVLVKQRQAAMTLQAKYFGPLVGMARGNRPYEAELVARNAKYLEMLAAMPWDGFPESTQAEETRALPAVWSEPEKFRRMTDEFQAAVAALVARSNGGDEAEVKAAIEGVVTACGGCHDAFRRK